MAGRRDALVAAARVVLAAEAAATVGAGRGGHGRRPARRARLLERHPRRGHADARRAGGRRRGARARARVRQGRRGPGEWTPLSADPGSTFDDGLRAALHAAAAGAGVAAADLAAYAGHDAGVLARHLPAAMLFVRNETGVSHNPAEHADEADCLAACEVLARTLVATTPGGG